MLQVNRWREWERQGRESDEFMRIQSGMYKTIGTNRLSHFGRSALGQLFHRVDKSSYVNIRLMFIRHMKVDKDFDYHNFVARNAEEQLGRTLRLEWLMWAIAAVFLMLPDQSAVIFWAWGLASLLALLAGGKLASVMAYLAGQVRLMMTRGRRPHCHVIFT